MQTIHIIGSGAWATALAQAIRSAGKNVKLFARNKHVVDEINSTHTNSVYLPSIAIDQAITATTDFTSVGKCDTILLATPAQHIGTTCANIAAHIPKHIPLIICAKGIETATGHLMHEVVRGVFPDNNLAVLSGPTFAAEVARGLPAAVTIAADDMERAKDLCEALGSRHFRPYASTDIIGVEIAGAIKNVVAIGCGIVIGKGLGENARAALMTRSLREMTRLAIALGGKPETLMGLSGLGDLILTCGSAQSRNMSLGVALGKGENLGEFLKQRVSVAEGYTTSIATQQLAKTHGVDMPIIDAVVSVLHQGADVHAVMEQLLSRPFTME